jgi:hypothetical protein
MSEKDPQKDDSKILGDINPLPDRSAVPSKKRRAGSSVDWDGDPGTDDLDDEQEERPGSRDVGQSTEGTGGGTRNYRPAGTTGSTIGNRPE